MEANRTQRSQTLMRLVTGYQVAQVIFVTTKLDIPDLLSSGAKSSAALADEVTAVNILTRRMTSSVLLIKALGGGWDVSQIPRV